MYSKLPSIYSKFFFLALGWLLILIDNHANQPQRWVIYQRIVVILKALYRFYSQAHNHNRFYFSQFSVNGFFFITYIDIYSHLFKISKNLSFLFYLPALPGFIRLHHLNKVLKLVSKWCFNSGK